MSILIKNILIDDSIKDVFIENNLIKQIGENLPIAADDVIDGTRKALIPGFVNAHTHAAMTLFRGFGDDMALMPWLEQMIWPNEAKLTNNDVYWGAKLACLEMIKSGTTTFLDMYFKFHETARAVEEMGIRAVLSGTCLDRFDDEQTEICKSYCTKLFDEMDRYDSRIGFALGPHAIYTVSKYLLQWTASFAADKCVPIHLHLSETEGEVENCRKAYGTTPVRYLEKAGVLSPHLIIAHGIYVDDEEIELLAKHDVKVVHNPASNMKLASGERFKFIEMENAGITVALGTDGCSSSNNLDMIEAMKHASLLGKVWRRNPEALPAPTIFHAATASGAKALGLKTGCIKEGYLADLCLVDLHIPAFTPNHNFISNLVYSANGSCIDTVICDGKIVMRNKVVPGEDEILEHAAAAAYDLIKRKK